MCNSIKIGLGFRITPLREMPLTIYSLIDFTANYYYNQLQRSQKGQWRVVWNLCIIIKGFWKSSKYI